MEVFPSQDNRSDTGQCTVQALFWCNIQDERVRIVFVHSQYEKSNYQLTRYTKAGWKKQQKNWTTNYKPVQSTKYWCTTSKNFINTWTWEKVLTRTWENPKQIWRWQNIFCHKVPNLWNERVDVMFSPRNAIKVKIGRKISTSF